MKELTETQERILTVENLAEKRKRTSDDLARQVYELNQEIKSLKSASSNDLEKSLADMRQKNECVVINLRKEIKDLCDGRKQSEMKIIDANRRLDELLQENKGILKVGKLFTGNRVSDFNVF